MSTTSSASPQQQQQQVQQIGGAGVGSNNIQQQQHAADQSAGGEVIFSSDGLDPIPLPQLQPFIHRISSSATSTSGAATSAVGGGVAATTTTAINNADVVSTTDAITAGGGGADGSYHGIDVDGITPTQAFEVFAGKLYPTSVTTDGGVTVAATAAMAGGAVSSGQRVLYQETPLQRLARLRKELEELHNDISGGNPQNDSSNEDPSPSGGGADVDPDTSVVVLTESTIPLKTVEDLKSKLDQTGTLLSKRSENLTTAMESRAQEIRQPTSSQTAAAAVGQQKKGSVVSSSSSFGDYEERLQRLEQVIGKAAAIPAAASTFRSASGGGSATVTSASSITERLSVLENFQAKLDDKEFDVLQKRAKVIRQDLEAAAKARNKLMALSTGSGGGGGGSGGGGSGGSGAVGSSVGGGGGSSKEDSKMITELYDLNQQLYGIHNHLPVLVQRLQTLSKQHVDAGTWSMRLKACEDITTRLQTNVNVIENSITAVDNTIKTNTMRMENNIKQLDERMKNLMK